MRFRDGDPEAPLAEVGLAPMQPDGKTKRGTAVRFLASPKPSP